MRSVRDQLGRLVSVPEKPMRIVSTVPSQTELLFHLCEAERIVGITLFCIHPSDKTGSVQKIGGTKNLRIKKIRELQPDLIIANKEENSKEQIEELAQNFPIWVSDVFDLDSALEMILSVGDLCSRKEKAETLVRDIRHKFEAFSIEGLKETSALYFIWKDPWMLAGKGTFIDQMMIRAGFKNAAPAERYPQLSTEEIRDLKADVIFLSSEPYPFKEEHCDRLQYIFNTTCISVDGEMFSWYGSRLLNAPKYFYLLRREYVTKNAHKKRGR